MLSRSLLLCAFLAVSALPSVHAQVSILPYAGYDLDAEGVVVGLGVEVGLPLMAPVALSVRPSGEYVTGTALSIAGREFSQTVVQGNVDVIARLRAPGVQPYGGLGLAVRHLSLDTSDDDAVEGDQDIAETYIGANLIGGVALGALGPIRPFAQVRLTVADGTAFAGIAGIALTF